MAVQEHLHFVQPARQRQRVAFEFAIDAAAGDGGNRLHRMVDRDIEPQIPASGAGGVKLSDIAELGIERRDETLRGIFVDIEGAGVGEFLVETQVHRVGTQPVAAAGLFKAFAEQAQGAEGRGGQAEAVRQGRFEGTAGAALAAGTRQQPFQTWRGKISEDMLVGRFRPDQFGDKQGQMHGKRRRKTRGMRLSVP